MTDELLNFIKSFEGCRLSSYLDVGGVATIGWGMTYYPDTDISVKMTDKALTQQEADDYFISMVKPYYKGVYASTGGGLNVNQMTALVDFAYNLGLGAFKQSDLLTHVLKGTVTESDFTIYDHVGHVENQGLLARRIAEYTLFMKVEPLPINQNNNMESEQQVVAEVQARPQTVTIKSVTVVFDRTENGETIQTGGTTTVNITSEILAALQNPNAGLVEAGYTVTVQA